ncbi:recombination mediator RecR [Patescibacteria group bacterium]|nr:recombination mediator RecR [Patescibacteria group bacterium]MBU4453395.1 recombination mediator RecR [Patescibacteria group bacterium]MCG2687709.1 recombination mediator RecR [Candidatus Parcubacteria bacterium]
MRKFPAPIHNVVAALTKFPGVGPKTALRYAFSLLAMRQDERERLARSIIDLQNVQTCSECFAYCEQSICSICNDNQRSNDVLCIVSESRDISTIEAANVYHGKYLVLGGVLNPIEGQTPDILHVKELIKRLGEHPEIKEVILAFSPDIHGETTMMYLARKIKDLGRRATRLARGLPIGADLEYTDEVTLGDALIGRSEM